MSDRLLSTGEALAIWGGCCHRTMQRRLEHWYDSGEGYGHVEMSPGGHWRVREGFLRAMKERSRMDGVEEK